MEARNRPLEQWLARITSGQLQLPRFQRFEAWGYREIIDLLETVLAGMPAGVALVLEVGAKPPFKHRPLATADGGKETIVELLLDGQQRLTALWRALNDNYEDRSYYISLTEKNDAGGPAIQPVRRSTRADGKRLPLWADDPQQVLARDLVPVKLLMPGESGAQAMSSWLKAATGDDTQRHIELLNVLNPYRSKVSSFNLPFLSLPAGTSPAEVLDVFVKMNTRSIQLTAFDIIVANIEAEIGESLHDLLDSLRGQVPGLQRYAPLQDTVLRAAALWQDNAPDKPGFMKVDWAALLDDWPKLVYGANATVQFLEQESVYDAARFPIITPLAALIVLWAKTENLPPDRVGAARTLLRKYLWRAFFTERYESSAHTHVIRDVRALRKRITGEDNAIEPEIFEAPLPSTDDLLQAGWPRKRDRLARAILLTSFRGGAHDLADGEAVSVASLDKREYHHLFPKRFLADEQAQHPPDLALNCALITAKTNRTIAAADPVDYIRKRAEAAELADDEIAARLKTHAIDMSALVEGDYEQFLIQRAASVAAAMEALCAGHPWSP